MLFLQCNFVILLFKVFPFYYWPKVQCIKSLLYGSCCGQKSWRVAVQHMSTLSVCRQFHSPLFIRVLKTNCPILAFSFLFFLALLCSVTSDHYLLMRWINWNYKSEINNKRDKDTQNLFCHGRRQPLLCSTSQSRNHCKRAQNPVRRVCVCAQWGQQCLPRQILSLTLLFPDLVV